MSNFSMFSQPQTQYYNLTSIAQQTTTFRMCFNLGQELDSITPQIALMVASEVQTQARKASHPLRVNMHEYVSENEFINEQFRELVYVVLMRMGYGLEANEFPNMNTAAQQVISHICKAYAGGLAVHNPEFIAALDASDPDAGAEARRQAADWNYFVALSQGTVAFAPFKKGQQFSAVPRSAMQNTSAATNSNSGAFTDQPIHRPNTTAASSSSGPSRYERMLQKAVDEAPPVVTRSAAGGSNTGFGTRSMMNRAAAESAPAPTAAAAEVKVVTAHGKDAVDAFDTDIENESLEGLPPLANIRIGNKAVTLIRMLPYDKGLAAWKSCSIQPYLPVYCKRTHRQIFFLTTEREVIAVIQPLQLKEKAEVMNYEAHQIVPGMGVPDTSAPQVPVREEAKVLYNDKATVELRVVVANKVAMMVESLEGIIKAAQITGQRGDNNKETPREITLSGGIVNTLFTFSDKMIADDQLTVIAAANRSKSLVEAGEIIGKLDDAHMRRAIEKNVAADINDVLSVELGLSGIRVHDTISSYAKDLTDLIDTYGAMVAEKFEKRIPEVIRANLAIFPAATFNEYSEFVMAVDDEDKAPEEIVERSLILQRSVNVARVSYSNDELALDVPEGKAVVIEKQAVPALYAMAQSLYSENSVINNDSADSYILTNDGYMFKIHRALLSGSFLISKAGDI